MSKFIDRQREKRYSPNSVKAKYDRIRRRLPDSIFIFLEGLLDKALYGAIVESFFTEEKVTPILCDGKSGVLSAMDYVNGAPNKQPKCLFFIDRDLDELLGKTTPRSVDLYITDGYSIENDIARPEVLKFIINHVFHAEISSREVNSLVSKYKCTYLTYAKHMSLLMAWAIEIKKLGGRASLDNANMSKCFRSIELESIKRCDRALERFKKDCSPNISLLRVLSIRSEIKNIRRLPPDRYVRGKYALWFMIQYINEVKSYLRSRKPTNERAIFIDAVVDEETIVPLIAGRVPPPKSLSAFLKRASA